MKMMNNLIIGAGQLGSRHLQGVLKYHQSTQKIFVIDSSDESLKIAKTRAAEIDHKHLVVFQQDWENLPSTFDVVIVATNANVREQVVVSLLNRFQVKYLILEKVLFPELDAYKRINELLKTTTTKTWVNHPRRMFYSYNKLKELIGDSFTGVFQMTGGNWGLGCNGLHFIDLFEYLSGSNTQLINNEWIDLELLSSKRPGFIEFTGSLKGKLSNGSNFQISSLQGDQSAGTITVMNEHTRIIIQESGIPAIYQMNSRENFEQIVLPFKLEFQSSLTTKLLSDLCETGNCNLPVFEQAKQTHELFITAFLGVYNKILQSDKHILPIT